MTYILPYYEGDNAYKRVRWEQWAWWNPSPPGPEGYLNGIPMKIWVCPADSRSNLIIDYGGVKVALTAYLGCNGTNQLAEQGGQNGVLYVNSSVSLGELAVKDGSSNTIMVGERPPSYDTYYGWWFAGSGDYPYFGATDVVLGTNEYDPNGQICSPPCPTNRGPEFYRPGALQDPPDCHRWHFWSLHPAGANFLMGDGHVRNLPYSINQQIFTALGTRNGGEVLGDY
jgi:prepilin-type processing-associated H-X9-DG protein